MTNKKILQQQKISAIGLSLYSETECLKAMDEYAMQEAKSFLNFIVDGGFEKIRGDYDGICKLQQTPEQLYELYLQSKTK